MAMESMGSVSYLVPSSVQFVAGDRVRLGVQSLLRCLLHTDLAHSHRLHFMSHQTS